MNSTRSETAATILKHLDRLSEEFDRADIWETEEYKALTSKMEKNISQDYANGFKEGSRIAFRSVINSIVDVARKL